MPVFVNFVDQFGIVSLHETVCPANSNSRPLSGNGRLVLSRRVDAIVPETLFSSRQIRSPTCDWV